MLAKRMLTLSSAVFNLIVVVSSTSTIGCELLSSINCGAYLKECVCGSDGKTYYNRCYIAQATCVNATLHKVSDVPCDQISTFRKRVSPVQTTIANSVSITHSAVLRQLSICGFIASLDCTLRPVEYVCANDGKTYLNKCFLAKAECEDSTLHIVSDKSCLTMPTAHTAHTKHTTSTTVSTVITRTTEIAPIENVTSTSGCDYINQLNCATVDVNPVCGSNLKDYPNVCYLAKDQCLDATLHMVLDKPCVFYTSITTQKTPNMTTSFSGLVCSVLEVTKCSTDIEPVCASNNVWYVNACEFDKVKCLNMTLTVLHTGVC